uniref:Uncharacterized protein n=1 Tax=Nelumbo nucifera TaxID=4432 RepID=A0A822XUL2_NELNU|nr:TPA_asm: hypothetical protein HUJ06_024324 [Nelumbo nucifera]
MRKDKIPMQINRRELIYEILRGA